MKTLVLLFVGGLILWLVACVPAGNVEPASSDLWEAATVEARPLATPRSLQETRTPPPPPIATHMPTVDPTVLTTTPWPPDPIPSPTPVPPFPGMVYTTAEGLWQVNTNWQPELLFDRPGVLEPNGRRVLYEQDGDIWVLDLITGNQQNVTNTPDSIECCIKWWPNKPDTFFAITYHEDDIFESVVGKMTAVTLAGDTTILAQETVGASSISPDGQIISFEDLYYQPFLYQLGGEIELLTLESETLEEASWVAFENPIWSPDGQKIAWNIAYGNETQQWVALAIYHVGEPEIQILHPIHPAGYSGGTHPPVWHPNSAWVVFDAVDEVVSEQGSWVIAIDGSSQTNIGVIRQPVWNPDGRYLLYQTDEGYFLTIPPDFTTKINVYLPPGARVLDWQEIP
ncbi:MAG: PD40 domain-containing protein [Anaerolineae bacterium]|nr:PD40 domain-containing protein [Anaerolineae bacterium]